MSLCLRVSVSPCLRVCVCQKEHHGAQTPTTHASLPPSPASLTRPAPVRHATRPPPRLSSQVAKSFRDVFADLAPGCSGELVMIKNSARQGQSDAGAARAAGEEEGMTHVDGAADGAAAVDKYSGVKVKVQFGMGETLVMKQLSGGQKVPKPAQAHVRRVG